MTIIRIIKNMFVFLILIKLISPCLAAGVGFVNYDIVFQKYRYAQTVVREIETKGQEIQDYLDKKAEEYEKLETPLQKKKFETVVQSEIKTRENAFNDYREKREESVYTKIHTVTEKIRLEKGLDAILDARCVFSGGVDITEELINTLNSESIK